MRVWVCREGMWGGAEGGREKEVGEGGGVGGEERRGEVWEAEGVDGWVEGCGWVWVERRGRKVDLSTKRGVCAGSSFTTNVDAIFFVFLLSLSASL